MPHRHRMLTIAVTIIWIIARAATLVSAAVRSGGDAADAEQQEQTEAALMLVEAPSPPVANMPAFLDLSAPAG